MSIGSSSYTRDCSVARYYLGKYPYLAITELAGLMAREIGWTTDYALDLLKLVK